MDKRAETLIKNWKKRNIAGEYCENKFGAQGKILELIPKESTIGISGSQTLEQIGIIRVLEERGNKIFSPYNPDLSREEALNLRRLGTQADYYLASANAIAMTGELVFFSAFGNRTAGISFANNTIIVCGINKITENISQALLRAREYATPLNCKRLKWNTPCVQDGICRQEVCFFPENKRMCCQILIIEAEAVKERLKVVLVGESLGF
ncbi:MAG: lactate utilization protein [Candidatus Omnitrophota bacterium]